MIVDPNERMTIEPDESCNEQFDDKIDELDEALFNCSGFFDGEYFVCGAAGSEDCDWDCPFSRDLGLTAKQIEERDETEEAPQP